MDGLNKLGLPGRYAVLGAVAVPIGTFVSGLLGISVPDLADYLLSALAGGPGGRESAAIRPR